MAVHIPGTRALRTLRAAGRHLNFTRAAEELGLTPAAVSHQVKEFEEQIGVALFSRTSRSIELTEAGVLIVEAATDALDRIDRAVTRARRIKRGAAVIKLTTDAVFASKWLLPRADRFRRLHPDIELRFDIAAEVRDFGYDDVDIGIRFGGGKYPGVIAERLFDNVIIPVCSPALLQNGPLLNEPRDLLRHTLVHIEWSQQGVTWPNWRMWMAAAGIEDFDDSQCVLFEDTSHAVQAAIEGSVVALADFSMVAGDLSAGRLVRPFELGIKMPADFAYYLVYPAEAASDPRILAFREWVLGEASAEGIAQRASFL
jgi:LysR family glycine cleavage system transcriptional activator